MQQKEKRQESKRGIKKLERNIPASAAAGLTSVTSAVQIAFQQMGAVRAVQTLLKVNKTTGFDCPGCAWPDPDTRSTAEFCENGVKAVASEATTRAIDACFFAQWSVSDLLRKSDRWLEAQGRLVEPLIRRPGRDHYESFSWDAAFALIGRELRALSSPDHAIFYTSGRTSNEAAFLYQLFVRQFGTNNLPDCSNLCHESSGVGLSEVIGVGKGTVGLDDFDHADAIFILGQNPGTNHPRMLTTLEAAARRGCKIVSINPLKEVALVRFKHPQTLRGLLGPGTPISSLFLQVKTNGDVALLKGIMKRVLELEASQPGTVLDHTFIERFTSGFTAFHKTIVDASWEELEVASGLSRLEMEKAAEIYVNADRVIACWAMGLTQHKNGVANIQEIVNLLLLRGNLGRPGAGVCPVRGHSNVQGDRTMGISERPRPDFLARLASHFKFSPPLRHGYSVVEAIQAMHGGHANLFIGLGGNFHSATPDTAYTEAALQRCRLTVQVSTKLNRSHLVTGETALILPCLGRTERDWQAGGTQYVTVEDSMSMVHQSHGHLPPASPLLRSEVAIVAGIASETLGQASEVPWLEMAGQYSKIREAIAAVIPGFENFEQRVQAPGGFRLPNAARDRSFQTSDAKAHFTVHAIAHHALESGQLLMMTIRSHDQYNTTIYSENDRYRGIRNERRVVFVNPIDIDSQGLVEGQVVDLISHFNGQTRTALSFIIVAYDIPSGCVATYFPEANVLVPIDNFADGSLTPASKSIRITLRPARSLPDESIAPTFHPV